MDFCTLLGFDESFSREKIKPKTQYQSKIFTAVCKILVKHVFIRCYLEKDPNAFDFEIKTDNEKKIDFCFSRTHLAFEAKCIYLVFFDDFLAP